MSKCALCRKHIDDPIMWGTATICKECHSNQCNKCYMSKDSDWFWEAHQTMSDGTIWCVNAKVRK